MGAGDAGARGGVEPARGRRSQAQRRIETRARIVAAVFESIAEVGLARTTAAEVTRRAGVTWGAVQHHFGGKDGMLVAAVEDSFDHFAARFDGIDAGSAPLARRVALFVDGAWQHFASREYRSAFEILLKWTGRGEASATPSWREAMFRAWDRVWLRVFRDAPVPRRRHAVLEQYTLSVLTGLAATRMLEGGAGRREAELEILKDTLVRELG